MKKENEKKQKTEEIKETSEKIDKEEKKESQKEEKNVTQEQKTSKEQEGKKEKKAKEKKSKEKKEKDKKSKEKKPKEKVKETKTAKKKKKKKSKLHKIIVNLLELAFLAVLIVVIVHLVKSENGLLSRMHKKNAGEKLDAAIKEYSAAKEEEPDIENYLRRIEGLEELQVDKEAGTAELKIDGQGFYVVLGGNNVDEYDDPNGRIVDGIYIVEKHYEEENEDNRR